MLKHHVEPDHIRYAEALRRKGPPPIPPLRALTLHRPWSDAIVRGPKRVENRTWFPPARFVGQELAIHGGKTYDDHLEWPDGWQPSSSPMGIIGLTRLLGAAYRRGPRRLQVLVPTPSMLPERDRELVRTRVDEIRERLEHIEDEEWATHGSVHWLLDEPTAIEPVACKGKQGIWVVPTGEAEEVRRRVEMARGNVA